MTDNVLHATRNYYTPDESWSIQRERGNHWYNAQCDFAVEHLKGTGKCLVVGSPIFEAIELSAAGWTITYLDWRKPPIEVGTFVQSDARLLPFPDASFDALSSTCVLCHVGMGRYGDMVSDGGDEVALKEMARVAKPRATLAITFGPVADIPAPVNVAAMHRIYTVVEAKRMCAIAGLVIKKIACFDLHDGWMQEEDKLSSEWLDRAYLSMVLERD